MRLSDCDFSKNDLSGCQEEFELYTDSRLSDLELQSSQAIGHKPVCSESAMTTSSSERRWSTSSSRAEAFKFPDFEQSLPSRGTLPIHKEHASSAKAHTKTPSPNPLSKSNGIVQGGRQRRESHVAWGNTNGHVVGPGSRHVPQKSLSDAIRTIRTRKGSVSANAQELAEALKAPVSFKLIVCYNTHQSLCPSLTCSAC